MNKFDILWEEKEVVKKFIEWFSMLSEKEQEYVLKEIKNRFKT